MARRLKITTPYGDTYFIHGNGEIERGDGRNGPGSMSWTLLGIVPCSGKREFIPVSQITRELVAKTTWLYLNGKPKYTGVDNDHGTERVWGNTEHHGIRSIEVLDDEPVALKERVIYDNGRHQVIVHRNHNTGELCLKVNTDYNKVAGRTQWPTHYDDGNVGYDRPEVVPRYLREIIWQIYNNRSRKYAGIADYEGLV